MYVPGSLGRVVKVFRVVGTTSLCWFSFIVLEYESYIYIYGIWYIHMVEYDIIRRYKHARGITVVHIVVAGYIRHISTLRGVAIFHRDLLSLLVISVT